MKKLLLASGVSFLVATAVLLAACTPSAEPEVPKPSLDLATESSETSPVAEEPTSPEPPGLTQAVASLGSRLAPRLQEGDQVGNLAFSPLGIHVVLSVLASGAGESSRAGLAALLGLPIDDTFQVDYERGLSNLKETSGVELQVRLDCAQQLTPSPDWIASLSSAFQVHFEHQDFLHDARGSTARIDAWFHEQTRGRVPDVYGANVLPASSTLVASSALTFRMDWAQRFSLLETSARPFILKGGESVSVPTMRAEKLPILVARVGDAPANGSVGVGVPGPLWVALPFSGENTFLLLGLPATTGELPAIEQQLSDPGVAAIFNRMDAGEHEVLLPKIDWLTPTFLLTSQIQKLEGGEELTHLDLSGAGLSGPFSLSSLVQRVAVRWDEQGADLAAATSAAGEGIGLLLYDLASQVVEHLRGYLADSDEVRNVLIFHQRQISTLIHSQMQQHTWEEATSYEAVVSHGFSEVRTQAFATAANEAIRPYDVALSNKADIRKMLFGGFKKCLYAAQKFDSDPERRFAAVLERDSAVLKWFKPGKGVFQIRYTGDHDYEPDFVVETESVKLLCEPKRADQLDDPVVLAKARATTTWCKNASAHELANGGKPWRYVLIPHDAIADNMTVDGLVKAHTFLAPAEVD